MCCVHLPNLAWLGHQDARPTLDDPHGTNYWDNSRRMLTFVVKGTVPLTFRTLDTVLASATLETTTEEFFDRCVCMPPRTLDPGTASKGTVT
jgi:hypothetical protein